MTAFNFENIETQEQVPFKPEFLKFDELYFLAKRLQERLQVYRDEEALGETSIDDQKGLEDSIEKMGMVLSQVNRKIDLLKSLKIFYKLYDTWSFLLKGEHPLPYNDYLENDYKEFVELPEPAMAEVLKENTALSMAELIEAQGLKNSGKEIIEASRSAALLEELPQTIEEIAESPEAALVEADTVEEEEFEVENELRFADLYKAPVEATEDFVFEENRIEDNIAHLEADLAKLQGIRAWGQSKKKERLENKLNKQKAKIEALRSEHLKEQLDSFFESRSEQLEDYLLNLVKNRDHREVYRLYSSYEKLAASKAIPERLGKKLENQGLWGKILASGGDLDEAIKFSLLGSSLGGLGPSSVLTAADLPADLLMDTLSNGAKTYPLLKVGSDNWFKAHAWGENLSESVIQSSSTQELLQYLTAYEARALLNAEKVENDDYYKDIVKVLKGKFSIEREAQLEKSDLLMEYFEKENQDLNTELYDSLSKGKKTNARFKSEGALLGLFISDGHFRKVLDSLYWNSPSKNIEDSISYQFAQDGIKLGPDNSSFFADEKLENKEFFNGANSDDSNTLREAVDKMDQGYLNKIEDDFVAGHSLLSAYSALMDVMENKVRVTVEIDMAGKGHFKTERDALRVFLMDVFPIEKLIDDDGFSAIDAARLEKAITIFDDLLEGKDNGTWSVESIKYIIEKKNNYLIIHDYEAFADLAYELFAFSEKLSKAERNVFVKVAQSKGEEYWSEILEKKIAGINF